MEYGQYEYTFDIKNSEINSSPVISIFKTNWWEFYKVKVEIEIYKDGDYWNANVKTELNGSRNINEESFEDIENNMIELRWGP